MSVSARVRRLAFVALATAAVLFSATETLYQLINVPCLWDFGAFIAAGRSLAGGENPYVIAPSMLTSIPGLFDATSPNLNAPASLLVFRHLAWVEPISAFRIWSVLSAVFYLLAVSLVLSLAGAQREPLAIVFALATTGPWITIFLGQVYNLLLLIVVVSWILLSRGRYTLAGILIGLLVAIKPNFALWSVCLLVAGYSVPALVSLIAAGIVELIPVMCYGPAIISEWLSASQSYPGLPLAINGSLWGLGARLGSQTLGALAGALLVAGVLIWLRRARPDTAIVSALALGCLLASSPLGWVANTVWVLPVFFAFRWNGPLALSAVLLLLPNGVVYRLSHLPSIWADAAGLVYPGAYVLLLWGIVVVWQKTRSRSEAVSLA